MGDGRDKPFGASDRRKVTQNYGNLIISRYKCCSKY